jgi:hypothetical protein
MDVLVFAATTGLLGILVALPTLAIGPMLAARGIVREEPAWAVVTFGAALVLVTRLAAPTAPPFLHVGIAMLATLATYNPDLWSTFREGRWWWLKGKDQPRKHDSLTASIVHTRKPHNKKRYSRWDQPSDHRDVEEDS